MTISKNQRDKTILQKIVVYCSKIAACKVRFGSRKEDFIEDDDYQAAVTQYLVQIGELTGRLSDEFKKQHQSIAWPAIKGLRNVVAHEYEQLDVVMVWETINEDIPYLVAWLKEYLQCKNVNKMC